MCKTNDGKTEDAEDMNFFRFRFRFSQKSLRMGRIFGYQLTHHWKEVHI